MRLLVVGAGSTGGYFGGRLAQACRDVTFLVRPRRAAQLEANGLQVTSPHGDFTLAPKLVTTGGTLAHFDAILLTVKSYAFEASLEDFAPAIGPDTMILPVLNGMRHMDVLAARFGKHAVAGCVCKIPAQLDREGRILHLGEFHELDYGELDGSRTPRIGELDAFMRNAVFNARLSPAIDAGNVGEVGDARDARGHHLPDARQRGRDRRRAGRQRFRQSLPGRGRGNGIGGGSSAKRGLSLRIQVRY